MGHTRDVSCSTIQNDKQSSHNTAIPLEGKGESENHDGRDGHDRALPMAGQRPFGCRRELTAKQQQGPTRPRVAEGKTHR